MRTKKTIIYILGLVLALLVLRNLLFSLIFVLAGRWAGDDSVSLGTGYFRYQPDYPYCVIQGGPDTPKGTGREVFPGKVLRIGFDDDYIIAEALVNQLPVKNDIVYWVVPKDHPNDTISFRQRQLFYDFIRINGINLVLQPIPKSNFSGNTNQP